MVKKDLGWGSLWSTVKLLVNKDGLITADESIKLIATFILTEEELAFTLVDGVYMFGPVSTIKALGLEVLGDIKI